LFFFSLNKIIGKRRDNAPIGSDTQNELVKILLKDGKWGSPVQATIQKAEEYVKSVIMDLFMNRTDMSKLVITKGLSKTDEQYARGGTKQPHVELKKRINRRKDKTGEQEPETGDRVGYVMTSQGVGAKACEKAEDPMFALKNGVPIDVNYYIHKQIWPAVIRILTGVHEPDMCVAIRSSMPMKEREGLVAHQRLFLPHLDHMSHKRLPKARDHGIAKFTVARNKCLGCRLPLNDDKPCCKHCDTNLIRGKRQQELEQLQKRKDDAWETCRKCQGGRFMRITCSNVGCDNFFHRDRTIMDLEDLAKDMKRF
jgi:DNA polymerase delta subunit 1